MRSALNDYPGWAFLGAIIGAISVAFAAMAFRSGAFGWWYPLGLLVGGLFVGITSLGFLLVLYRIRHMTG